MEYRNHTSREVLLSPHYGKHVSAMTGEALHSKADIAEELAHRDMRIEELIALGVALREENERLKALVSKLDGQLGRRPCQNGRCVNFNQQAERITDLNAQLAAADELAESRLQQMNVDRRQYLDLKAAVQGGEAVCQHTNTSVHWDHVACKECGWVLPGGDRSHRPDNGWFPSMAAFEEWKKYKTYHGMKTKPAIAGKVPSAVQLALDYSRNFASAKVNIGSTEKEHILGLCDLLERTAKGLPPPKALTLAAEEAASQSAPIAEQVDALNRTSPSTAEVSSEGLRAALKLVLPIWYGNDDEGAFVRIDCEHTEHAKEITDLLASWAEGQALSQQSPATECQVNKFSSRCCERGTKSCVIKHDSTATVEGELTDDVLENIVGFALAAGMQFDKAEAFKQYIKYHPAIERALNQRLAVKEGEAVERNFCSRCGKRVNYKDANAIHTCSPPKNGVDDQQAKDAARYRWLRERVGVDNRYGEYGVFLGCGRTKVDASETDAAIDAALSTTKQEG